MSINEDVDLSSSALSSSSSSLSSSKQPQQPKQPQKSKRRFEFHFFITTSYQRSMKKCTKTTNVITFLTILFLFLNFVNYLIRIDLSSYIMTVKTTDIMTAQPTTTTITTTIMGGWKNDYSNSSSSSSSIFPTTRFTPHISQMVQYYDPRKVYKCASYIELQVSEPYTKPIAIIPGGKRMMISNDYHKILTTRVFGMTGGTYGGKRFEISSSGNNSVHITTTTDVERHNASSSSSSLSPKHHPHHHHLQSRHHRVLPGNLTLGISSGDWMDVKLHGYSCFGSSTAKGFFSIINFLEINRLAKGQSFSERGNTNTMIPWEERHTIPIWRGTGWTGIKTPNMFQGKEHEPNVLDTILSQKVKQKRIALVVFSKQHPTMVDAKLASSKGIFNDDLWKYNATNGLHALLPFHSIPQVEYYKSYQVAIVMGGIGAAFRTPIHLSLGTAVILQDFPYEEWFVHLMEPFVHYIPLRQDISNLNETLQWVQENPQKVKEIADNGKAFYEEYLSFEASEEFLYELVYRLAAKVNE